MKFLAVLEFQIFLSPLYLGYLSLFLGMQGKGAFIGKEIGQQWGIRFSF